MGNAERVSRKSVGQILEVREFQGGKVMGGE